MTVADTGVQKVEKLPESYTSEQPGEPESKLPKKSIAMAAAQ
jgi:hypothetical protein